MKQNLMILFFLLFGGCSASHTAIKQPITASAVGHVQATQSYLSDIDGKAVSIQQLLK